MTTQTMPEPIDMLVWRADNGLPPFYFATVEDALGFVAAELRALDALDVATVANDPAAFHTRVRRCAVLAAECGRLHLEWAAQNPKEQYS